MISLHLLHCVPQSLKRRTIHWVFPPTVKHNLIANREKDITHHYITSRTREGPGPRLFLVEFNTPEADKYFLRGRSPSNIRLWMISGPTYS